MKIRVWAFIKSPFFVFTLLLLVKIYITRMVIFDMSNIWKPLLTDLPTVAAVFCLIEWLSGRRRLLYYLIADTVMTSIYFAAIMYHQYYGVIVTYHALQQANQVTQVKGSVFQLMHPYFLTVYVDVVLIAILLFRKSVRGWSWSYGEKVRTGAAALMVVLMLVCAARIVVDRNGMNEIKLADEMGVLNYEIFTFFPERKDSFNQPSVVTQADIDKIKGDTEASSPQLAGVAKGKNVIVIQLEAFQNFLLGLKLDGKEVTPNLNVLMKEALYFPHFYQMVGQGNTSDAEFVVNTSLYIPPHGAASSNYADRALPAMPKLFHQQGYLSATFHTNDISFWNRKELYNALGFDRYYDKSFFGSADPVALASSDEVLYEKTADELDDIRKSGKPFYAQLISLSSHHPFKIPSNKFHMDLPEQFQGTFVGDYMQAQNYTDYALGQFFEKLKASHLWENALIVIYGDHMGLPMYSLSDKDKMLLHDTLGQDYGYQQMLNVPLIVIAPGTTKPAVISQAGGQVDVMPTIANLMGFSLQGFPHFGEDLVNAKRNLLPQHYYLPRGSFINNDAMFVPGDDFDDGTHYPLDSQNNADGTTATKGEYDMAQQLFALSDNYVKGLPPSK